MTAAANPDKAFYTPREVAAATGMNYETVLRQIKKGGIPAERFGTLYKVPVRWVEERAKQALVVVPDPTPALPDYTPLVSVMEIFGRALLEAADTLRRAS